MATDNSGTLALLIDGDNASPKIVDGLLAEIANYGLASVKRIYGDWTGPNLKGWKQCLLEHSILPVQQFAYTTGKNATDGAMIIDAMDLLYIGRFSGFCIVSSDSDFARLAARIREQGITVYGFGERKTPRPFITACDKFIYFDVLNAVAPEAETPVATEHKAHKPVETAGPTPPISKRGPAKPALDKSALDMLTKAVIASADEDGRANLGRVGGLLDPVKGGRFSISPHSGEEAVSQTYLENTNVLVTKFETPDGASKSRTSHLRTSRAAFPC